MKRVMSVIVLAMMVILPMSVHAALDFSGFKCDEKKVETDGTTTKTCYIVGTATGSSSLSEFTGTLTLQNMSVKSITAADGWTNANGTSTNLKFTTTAPKSNSTFTIATIVFTVDTTKDKCAVQLVPCYTDGQYTCGNTVTVTESKTCKVENGKYYGKDGTEVTAEEYQEQCVKNPQTGNFVPYVVIIAGIALAVGVFTISRKNTKLYKI